jgi:heptosyltransferase II
MKVAIFWPNWIGDAVMATPAVRALRRHYADARFIAVHKPYIAGVLDGSPWFEDRLLFDPCGSWEERSAAVIRRLRELAVDLAILFPNSFRAAWMAWRGGCRKRIGYARYGRSLLLTRRLRPARSAWGRLTPSPAIDAFNRLGLAAGCPDPGHRMELFTTPADEAAADEVWQGAGFSAMDEIIGLNPGAAFGSAKFWPIESFAELARRLVDRRGSRVLVLCGPAEREAARQIVARAAPARVYSLADYPVNVGLTKACVRRLDLLVTTDSGPRHFAAAFDRPVITLFGPTHIAWTETYFPRAVHLQKKVECGPCQKRVCPLDHRCMRLLSAEEVFHAAADLLKRQGRTPSGLPLQAAG